jgi:cytochrome P450
VERYQVLNISDDDVVSPDLYADEEKLHQMFATLRREEPVRWTAPRQYRPFWAISKHADIQAIERDFSRFIVGPRNRLQSIEEEERVRAASGGIPLMRTLPTMDDPDHKKYRLLTRNWFLPANLKRLESQIQALVTEYLDLFESAGGEAEFVNQVSLWIPLRVIMLILGIPPEDGPMMHRLTGQLFSPLDSDTARATDGHAIAEAGAELFAYFKVLLAKRREDPREDLATAIANGRIDDAPINEHEALSYCVTITAAGHETTSSSIAGGLHALIKHPAQYAALRADPSLLGSTIDEIFRYVSPVRSFIRVAVNDYELRGKVIKAGDSVLLLYPSANRDEDVFEDSQAFRITRTKNSHMAFGFGPHTCLGHLLARMELKAFFSQFIARVESAELQGEASWLRANFLGGPKQMYVRCRFGSRQCE